MDEILRRCGEAVELGATQVMLQGGHHPDYGVEYYEELFSSVKQAYPQLAIHSIGPSEILHMAKVSGVSIEEAVVRIMAAGLDSIAGAGAEMLPDRPRRAIAPLKESGARWLEVMEVAHRHGVESTATMMMGTGETNAERIEHIRMIRDVQDRAGGFRAFIPWTYQPENNHLDRKSTRLNSSYANISYAVFCLKKKTRVPCGRGDDNTGMEASTLPAVTVRENISALARPGCVAAVGLYLNI